MNDFANRITKLKGEIIATALKCHRNPDEIILVAVTKIADVPAIIKAYNTGHRDFGENYIQNILPKMNSLPGDIWWHFIGAVQTNKINKIIGKFTLVHSIDSLDTAQAFESRLSRQGLTQRVLLEVNASGENQKEGISLEKSGELAYFIKERCPSLKLEGLMTVAPLTDDLSVIATTFDKVRKLRDNLIKQGLNLPHLSMGMTNDWRLAIEYGATILRIGTAIFG